MFTTIFSAHFPSRDLDLDPIFPEEIVQLSTVVNLTDDEDDSRKSSELDLELIFPC